MVGAWGGMWASAQGKNLGIVHLIISVLKSGNPVWAFGDWQRPDLQANLGIEIWVLKSGYWEWVFER
jgi:hypothetical protein